MYKYGIEKKLNKYKNEKLQKKKYWKEIINIFVQRYIYFNVNICIRILIENK